MTTGTIILPVPGQFDATNPPGLSYFNSKPRALFDDTTSQTMHWTFRMPQDFASGLIAKMQFSMAGANTSDKIEFEASLMAVSDGDAVAIDTDSYDTVNNGVVTVPDTAGHLDEVSITMTNDDSVAAGDWCAFKLSRDADDGTNDTATGDLELVAMSLEYTTT